MPFSNTTNTTTVACHKQLRDGYFVEFRNADGFAARADPREYTKIIAKQRHEFMANELSRQACDDYLEDITKHLRLMEDETLPDVASIDIQPEIQWFMRSCLLDFLIEAHQSFQLFPETLFLTINLLDRYCSRRVVYKRHYQLVGCASLLIAAKYGDSKGRVPMIKELKAMCCSLYDEDMFRQMEWHVLNALEWSVGHPTVHSFLQIALMEDYDEVEVEHMARYICEVALYHRDFVSTKPSVMARASMALARIILGRQEILSLDQDENLTVRALSQRLHEISQILGKKYCSPQQAAIERGAVVPPAPPCEIPQKPSHNIDCSYSTPQKNPDCIADSYSTSQITPAGDFFLGGLSRAQKECAFQKQALIESRSPTKKSPRKTPKGTPKQSRKDKKSTNSPQQPSPLQNVMSRFSDQQSTFIVTPANSHQGGDTILPIHANQEEQAVSHDAVRVVNAEFPVHTQKSNEASDGIFAQIPWNPSPVLQPPKPKKRRASTKKQTTSKQELQESSGDACPAAASETPPSTGKAGTKRKKPSEGCTTAKKRATAKKGPASEVQDEASEPAPDMQANSLSHAQCVRLPPLLPASTPFGLQQMAFDHPFQAHRLPGDFFEMFMQPGNIQGGQTTNPLYSADVESPGYSSYIQEVGKSITNSQFPMYQSNSGILQPRCHPQMSSIQWNNSSQAGYLQMSRARRDNDPESMYQMSAVQQNDHYLHVHSQMSPRDTLSQDFTSANRLRDSNGSGQERVVGDAWGGSFNQVGTFQNGLQIYGGHEIRVDVVPDSK